MGLAIVPPLRFIACFARKKRLIEIMSKDMITAAQNHVDQGVGARNSPLMWDGQRYWVKIALKPQKNNWHRLQNLLAGILGCPMLRATVSHAYDQGLSDEARRLQRVAERGMIVPPVVAQRPGWLLLGDIGQSLFDHVQQSETKQDLLCQGACALAQLHQNGGWHGTGQLRDMVLTPDNQVGFLDFEENVGEAMPPADAQARDILRFLISAVRFDKGDGALLRAILQTYKQGAPDQVWPPLQKILKRASVLTSPLHPFKAKLGRDLRHALLVIQALKQAID